MGGAKTICAAVPVLSRAHQDQLRGIFEYARKAGWRIDVFDHGAYTQPLSQSEILNVCDGLILIWVRFNTRSRKNSIFP